jgi:DivIVA domain-containing protein
MKLTSTEIRSQEFPQKMRGYSKLDVDVFLQLVGDTVDGMTRRNEELMERITEMESKVKKVEEREALLERSLQAMTELREEMKGRTDSLLKAAQSESRSKIRQAEGEAARIREEAEWSVRRVREEVDSLETTRQRALIDFIEFLRSQHLILEREASRLGVELSPMTGEGGDKVVSIKIKAEGVEA